MHTQSCSSAASDVYEKQAELSHSPEFAALRQRAWEVLKLSLITHLTLTTNSLVKIEGAAGRIRKTNIGNTLTD